MHIFCKECLHGFAESKINDGAVQQLICPSLANGKQCKTFVREKDLLLLGISDELQEKYTRFSIQGAIDCMDDFGYCVKCEGPAEMLKAKNLGLCTSDTCGFQFCTQCEKQYHPLKRCDKLTIDKNIFAEKKDECVKIKRLADEAASSLYLKECTKKCPHCEAHVSKIEGCNKMTCSSCGKFFCWFCLQAITGYDHFKENKACWDMTAAQANIRDRLNELEQEELTSEALALLKDQHDECSICPLCQNFNIRSNRICDIKCTKCSANYCFMCNKVLRREEDDDPNDAYKKHFEESDCYYKEP